MSYQMEYDYRELIMTSPKKRKPFHVILAAFLLTAVVVLSHFGGSALALIISGQYGEINSAATQMVDHLREGMDLNEAVYVFYDEIFNEQAAD